MTRRLARLDRPGDLNGAPEEEQFFRQSRLAGIGMADDSEGPAAIDFFLVHLIHLSHFKTIHVITGVHRSARNRADPWTKWFLNFECSVFGIVSDSCPPSLWWIAFLIEAAQSGRISTEQKGRFKGKRLSVITYGRG